MAYEPQSIPSFAGGLNLRDKADAVDPTQAIDALNVVFTERGAVQQRDGYDNFTSSALTNAVASLEPYYKTDGTKQLLAGCGTRLEAINTSGAVVAATTGLTTGTWDFCRFGAPGSEVAYAGNGKNLLRKWDGSAWASVANSPKARYLAVMAVDKGNRMVAAGFDDGTNGPAAAQAYTSRVWFSDPGAPETWGANNYVDVTPGDGELIQNVTVWRENVIVWKQTKFFVFYGTEPDASGNPIFRYTTIDTGIGLASPRAAAVAPNGVYFMGRDGVYFTSGSDPEQVSDLIDPIWSGNPSDFYGGGVLAHANITNCSATWHSERLYLAFPTSSANNRVLVHDPRYGWWSLWDIPAACLASFRVSDPPELVFGYASGSNHIGRQNSTYTNDDGAAITSYWRSGWDDYGLSIKKTIRETKLWGTGGVSLGVSVDFAGSKNYSSGTTLEPITFSSASVFWQSGAWQNSTWAGSLAVVDKLIRHAVRGHVFSTSFFNNTLNRSFSIHRLDHHLRETQPPSKL